MGDGRRGYQLFGPFDDPPWRDGRHQQLVAQITLASHRPTYLTLNIHREHLFNDAYMHPYPIRKRLVLLPLAFAFFLLVRRVVRSVSVSHF